MENEDQHQADRGKGWLTIVGKQNSPNLDRWLSKIRERIEGVFLEIQNTGRNIERLLAKTVLGLTTRVITKMTAHLLRHLLRIDFGVNVQTFEVAATS